MHAKPGDGQMHSGIAAGSDSFNFIERDPRSSRRPTYPETPFYWQRFASAVAIAPATGAVIAVLWWKVLCIKLNNASNPTMAMRLRHHCPLRQRPVRRLEFALEGFMHKT